MKKNGNYFTEIKERDLKSQNNIVKNLMQYEAEYTYFSSNKSSGSKSKYYITLYKTDSNIYLFSNFASIVLSFKNSREMILEKLNKVVLIDIKEGVLSSLKNMFKDDENVILSEKKYTSTNGSKMVLLVLDLTKIYKKK